MAWFVIIILDRKEKENANDAEMKIGIETGTCFRGIFLYFYYRNRKLFPIE